MALKNVASKRLQFEIVSPERTLGLGERLGRLIVSQRNTVDTPNFLAITSRGVIPHITPDVIQEHLKLSGVHFALEDFIERSGQGKTPPITQSSSSNGSPIHSFTALPSQHLTLLAARRTPAVSSPAGNSNTEVSVFTSTGFQRLSSKDYSTYIRTLKPDIAISLADIPTSGTANSTKRLNKMTDRTTTWLKDLIYSQKTATENTSAIFAPILPLEAGHQSEYFEFLTDDFSGDFQGLAFYSADLVPDIPPTTTLSKLPRLSLAEPSSPQEILRQIALGIDLMIIPFITKASEAGIALDFQFPCPQLSDSTNESNAVLPLGTNIWISPSTDSAQPPHATNTLPVSSDCTCYTCINHSIAYIHHLLSAKEMLAWTLLQIHNHHVLSEFFASVRTSIGEGRFEEDCAIFERRYESSLPEKTGKGPRVRGYHFRDEGAGEGRRNEKSWGGL